MYQKQFQLGYINFFAYLRASTYNKERKMKGKNLYTTLIFCLVSGPVFAEGIPIEPGKWKMTSTMVMPMLPQPRVTDKFECIEEDEISPEAMTDEGMDSGCTFDTRIVDGNTMKWSMSCNSEGGESRGEWEVTSHGDTLNGEGAITVDMQGQSMVMTMTWDGQRVGDCD
jgi:hypothetical protein